ncbi:TolC family outer membrane protein [Hyphobacterium sp. SN044]|uniref:TolC family outer membrane protein n=1 Tax=Hyphobacterium sp. SN044 TaxID=2912575 RepID=UPI001F003483|nr:TolC family outer membrane protein [Hyphobacterium sp. SN044]MCF8879333.1 TolC family outer membrane protein [Hyphobacterium sp. SN044]
MGLKTFLTAGAMALSLAGIAGAQTLEETLALAYQTNPTLQAERARVRASGEAVTQARAAWLPSISASASISNTRNESSGGFFNQSNTVTPKSYQITASQAIWRSGQITGGIDQAQANALASLEGLRAIEQSILFDAANAFMNVRRDETIVDIRRNNVEVLSAQLRAAEDRFEVGEITRTDVAQAEARLSASRAQLTAAQAQLAASRSSYTRLVGQAPATLSEPPSLPSLPETIDEAESIALDFSPTLRAAAFSEEAALANVRVAQGAMGPSVSLSGNASRSHDSTFAGDESTRYSLGATVSMPIFTGGLNQSRVRQANYTADAARQQVAVSRRQTLENVSNAYNNLLAAQSVIVSSREAVRANEIALDGVQQEAQVGLRTTLDVLNAEQELLNARLTLVSAERDAYVAGLALLQAMGLLTAETLDLPVETSDPLAERPQANFDLTPWN